MQQHWWHSKQKTPPVVHTAHFGLLFSMLVPTAVKDTMYLQVQHSSVLVALSALLVLHVPCVAHVSITLLLLHMMCVSVQLPHISTIFTITRREHVLL